MKAIYHPHHSITQVIIRNRFKKYLKDNVLTILVNNFTKKFLQMVFMMEW